MRPPLSIAQRPRCALLPLLVPLAATLCLTIGDFVYRPAAGAPQAEPHPAHNREQACRGRRLLRARHARRRPRLVRASGVLAGPRRVSARPRRCRSSTMTPSGIGRAPYAAYQAQTRVTVTRAAPRVPEVGRTGRGGRPRRCARTRATARGQGRCSPRHRRGTGGCSTSCAPASRRS